MEFPDTEIQLTWPLAPAQVELAASEIHVWSARVPKPGFDYSARLGMLTPNEQQRAGMLRFDRNRRDFIARRALLRIILGRYLKMEPSRVPLEIEERGKPRLRTANGAPPLHFNLSHSRNLVLLAVGKDSPLGIDIEKIRPMPEMDDIAAAFFSAQENELLANAGHGQTQDLFFKIWTRKEAYLKATGEGIARELKLIDCSQPPADWTLQTLSPAPGFIGAVAAKAGLAAPICWQWAG